MTDYTKANWQRVRESLEEITGWAVVVEESDPSEITGPFVVVALPYWQNIWRLYRDLAEALSALIPDDDDDTDPIGKAHIGERAKLVAQRIEDECPLRPWVAGADPALGLEQRHVREVPEEWWVELGTLLGLEDAETAEEGRHQAAASGPRVG